MPKSKKRVKKPQEEQQLKSKNIIHGTAGKVVLVILAASFVFSGLALLIYTLVQAMQ